MGTLAGRDQIAADEDEREQHQDEIERVHRQRAIMLRPTRSDKRSQLRGSNIPNS
jgi:nitric oxide reductase activation protein